MLLWWQHGFPPPKSLSVTVLEELKSLDTLALGNALVIWWIEQETCTV